MGRTSIFIFTNLNNTKMTDKISVRQKMINMMYLVLTAMLALNVSAEILRAFFLIETSMAKAGDNTDRKIAYNMAVFEKNMKMFPEKTGVFYNKAVTAKNEMDVFITYISSLKKELETVAGGRKEDGQLVDADNTDKPSHLMIAQGKGAELKTKINELKTRLTVLLDSADQQSFKPALHAEDPSNSAETWESNMFDNIPAAASMVILGKIETDARNTADEVINKLRAAITKDEVTVNNFRAGVIPSSRYVMIGENYEADIFLSAWDSLNEIKVKVNNSEIPVVNGKATYKVSPTHEGEISFKGVLESKERNGTIRSIPFDESFFAFKPAATISADKMNTLYIGIDNPISVSVPGLRPTGCGCGFNRREYYRLRREVQHKAGARHTGCNYKRTCQDIDRDA
jgi:gliding motility-associated protein GldM